MGPGADPGGRRAGWRNSVRSAEPHLSGIHSGIYFRFVFRGDFRSGASRPGRWFTILRTVLFPAASLCEICAVTMSHTKAADGGDMVVDGGTGLGSLFCQPVCSSPNAPLGPDLSSTPGQAAHSTPIACLFPATGWLWMAGISIGDVPFRISARFSNRMTSLCQQSTGYSFFTLDPPNTRTRTTRIQWSDTGDSSSPGLLLPTCTPPPS